MRELTLIRANLGARKLRFVLTCLGVLTAFLLFGVLASITNVSADTSGTAARRLVVMNRVSFTQPLPAGYASRVREVPGVAAATHSSWFGGFYREPRNFLIALAIDPESYFSVYPEIAIAETARERFVSNRTGLLIGETVANRYGWKAGDTVPLQSNLYAARDGRKNWDFQIAGVYKSSSPAQANSVLLHYDYLNARRNGAQDVIGQIVVLTAQSSKPADVGVNIDKTFAADFTRTETLSEDQFSTLFLRQLGDVRLFIRLVVGASFISILFILVNTMMLSVRERTSQIAVLKTLGFKAPRILRLLLAESLLISLIGGFGGLCAAAGVISALGHSGALSDTSMPGWVWATGMLLILLLGLVTVLIPARFAYRLNIATALHRR